MSRCCRASCRNSQDQPISFSTIRGSGAITNQRRVRAGGTSLGRKALIDPESWVLVDGKRFLGGSSGAIDFFNKDTEEKMAKPDTNWEQLGQTE